VNVKISTSSIFLRAALLAAYAILSSCLNDARSSRENEARLVVQTTLKDVSKVGSLGKPSAIRLSKLVFTLTSSVPGDTVRRDTVLADTGSFLSNASVDQQFNRPFAVRPLRNWTIVVKSLDANDSLIHYDSVVVPSLLIGEARAVNMNLASRYAMYEARYTLAAELYPTGVPESQRVYQKVFFSRLVLSVDGRVVSDSSSFSQAIQSAGTRFVTASTALRGAAGRFFFKPNGNPPDTATHIQFYQYVRTGTRIFDISAYGYLEGDTLGMAPRLLFQGARSVTIAQDGSMPSAPIVLQWKGPTGAPSDTITAGHPDWSGVGLSVLIGKTNTIQQQIDIPPGISL
jgi:hypothetical protein